MNEKEIIENIKEMIQWSDHNTYKMALQGILDLYNKEKDLNNELQIRYKIEHEKYLEEKARNKNLEQIEKEHKEENGRLREENKIINKIYDFCRRELAFEKRLKREKRKPDEFNQGRFYVCENIKAIITNKAEEDIKE